MKFSDGKFQNLAYLYGPHNVSDNHASSLKKYDLIKSFILFSFIV